MAKISGFESIETGIAVVNKGKEYSVAELIEIINEIQHNIDRIDLISVLQFLELAPSMEQHIVNSNIHLTSEQKSELVNIIEEYLAGTLGASNTQDGPLNFINRTALLADTTETNCILAVVQTEPMNLYMWSSANNKWGVKDGNIYTTATMPTSTDFYIPSGTLLINSEDGSRNIWTN